jgi:CRP/FNR family cyclic AMP-dependent transcriptional regulator
MGLVEAHLPRSAMVYAKTPAGLVTIDEQRFLSLVAANPDFALSVMRILSRRLRRMDERYETTRSDGI